MSSSCTCVRDNFHIWVPQFYSVTPIENQACVLEFKLLTVISDYNNVFNGFFVLWHLNLHWLIDTKAILVEEHVILFNQ